MVRPIEQAPIHMSFEEVAVCAGDKFLMVVHLYFTDFWHFRPAMKVPINTLIITIFDDIII